MWDRSKTEPQQGKPQILCLLGPCCLQHTSPSEADSSSCTQLSLAGPPYLWHVQHLVVSRTVQGFFSQLQATAFRANTQGLPYYISGLSSCGRISHNPFSFLTVKPDPREQYRHIPMLVSDGPQSRWDHNSSSLSLSLLFRSRKVINILLFTGWKLSWVESGSEVTSPCMLIYADSSGHF